MQDAVVPLFPALCRSNMAVPSTKVQGSMTADTELMTTNLQRAYILVHETCHLEFKNNNYY